MQLMGVGETTATAIVAMVGNASEFSCGRQFAAWVGLVPGQYSSGGKARLGRITKAGDAYLRSLLVMGDGRARGAGRRHGQERQPQAAGRWPSSSGAATGRRWWPLRPRARAWPGPCSPRVSRSSWWPEGRGHDHAAPPLTGLHPQVRGRPAVGSTVSSTA